MCSDNGSLSFSLTLSFRLCPPFVHCVVCVLPHLLFKWKQKTLFTLFKTTIMPFDWMLTSLFICENDDCFNESSIWKHFVIYAIKSQLFFVFLCVRVEHSFACLSLLPPSFLPFLCPSSMWRWPSRLLGRAIDPNVSGLQPNQQHAVVRWKVHKPAAL